MRVAGERPGRAQHVDTHHFRAHAARSSGGSAITPGEFLVRTLRELENANRQLVALLKARKALRETRYEQTPAEYGKRVAALQAEIDAVIAQIQSLHDLIRDIRD